MRNDLIEKIGLLRNDGVLSATLHENLTLEIEDLDSDLDFIEMKIENIEAEYWEL